MRTPRPLPDDLVARAFNVKEARLHGVTAGRTRARDLAQPFRGTRMPSVPDPGFGELCRAYATRMAFQHYFSHRTAAQLLGLPLPSELERNSTLHVGAILPARAPRMEGVVGHHSREGQVRVVLHHGLRVASPLDVWRQLSATLSLEHLVAVGDALVRRKNPFCTVADLRQSVERFRGQRGARYLAAALQQVRSGVDSPKETEVRLAIVNAGLPEPLVNATIRNRYGAFLALGDLVYPDQRVVIEYDGMHHFAELQQARRDIDRLDELMEEGWRVIRVTSFHLHRKAALIAKVRFALAEGARNLPAPARPDGTSA